MTRRFAPGRIDPQEVAPVLADEAQPGRSTGQINLVAGGVCLSACMLAALLLVLAHFNAIELPGCGTASDCSRASEGRWGKLPGTNWPLSFVGFAYFQALVAAYIYSGGRLPGALRLAASLGAAVSVLLVGVMIVESYLCDYCLAVHLLNVLFAVGYGLNRFCSGRQSIVPINRFTVLVAFAATLVATSLLLAVVDRHVSASAAQTKSKQLQHALTEAAANTQADKRAKSEFGPGRYFLGLKEARVHIVVVSDYQCPSCRAIDAQLRALAAGRSDVSISMRHFPFCTDCNKHIDKTRHSNACRAALAAEAAGTVGGSDAFWRMHDWLFARQGNFADDELQAQVAEIGLDEPKFRSAFNSQEILATVRSDTDAADAAGLRYTPMVFINGKPLELGH